MKVDKNATVKELTQAITGLLEEWLAETNERVIMLAVGDKAGQADGTDGLGLYFGGPHDMMGVTAAAISTNIPPMAKMTMVMALQDPEQAGLLKPSESKKRTRQEILDQVKRPTDDFDDFEDMDKLIFGVDDGHIH